MEIELVVCGKGHLKLSIEINWMTSAAGPRSFSARSRMNFWSACRAISTFERQTAQTCWRLSRAQTTSKWETHCQEYEPQKLLAWHAPENRVYHPNCHISGGIIKKKQCIAAFSMLFMRFPWVFLNFNRWNPALLNFICISTRRRAWQQARRDSKGSAQEAQRCRNVRTTQKNGRKRKNITKKSPFQSSKIVWDITSFFPFFPFRLEFRGHGIQPTASGPSKVLARRGGKTSSILRVRKTKGEDTNINN